MMAVSSRIAALGRRRFLDTQPAGGSLKGDVNPGLQVQFGAIMGSNKQKKRKKSQEITSSFHWIFREVKTIRLAKADQTSNKSFLLFF